MTVSDSGKIAQSSVQRKIKEPASSPSLRSLPTMILALVSHGQTFGPHKTRAASSSYTRQLQEVYHKLVIIITAKSAHMAVQYINYRTKNLIVYFNCKPVMDIHTYIHTYIHTFITE